MDKKRKGKSPDESMTTCYSGMVAITRAIVMGIAPTGIISDCYNAVVSEAERSLRALGGVWEHPDGMKAELYSKDGKTGITWYGKEMTSFRKLMEDIPCIAERYASISAMYYDRLGSMIGVPLRKIGVG